jgi:phosphatidylserine decarboxylase
VGAVRIRKEVLPFVGIVAVLGTCMGLVLDSLMYGVSLFLLGTACLLYFFRDPDRTPPPDTGVILSGADGRVMSVTTLKENMYLKTQCVRISVFLSLCDVHVNRAPLSGQATFLGYFPGLRNFAFRAKASETNQHNKILIHGSGTRCLIAQIVGPIARRVVYWLSHETPTPVRAGDRIGMMKFGSRLDIYLPASEVDVICKPSDKVRAGETIIAKIKSVGVQSGSTDTTNNGERASVTQ